MTTALPRLVIAGMAGDSGKTLVSVSLLAEFARRGVTTAAFKKGPDFIDAAWLGIAAGTPARHLDQYLMDEATVAGSFAAHAAVGGISVIEGNRGLYDGMETGLCSTAELAKLLRAPVILVIHPHKTTRTVAAQVLGCRHYDREVSIAGVIINQVTGERHASVVRAAIEERCGIPVLGVIPVLSGNVPMPDRHLGLVTPSETDGVMERISELAACARKYLDCDRLLTIARLAPEMTKIKPIIHDVPAAGTVRIGYFSDSAFTFYYPENLEALERAGATLIPISALSDYKLPDLDLLYIGGGFPETHAAQLEQNHALRAAVKQAADRDLPIYAECGGLVYLAESLTWKDSTWRMAGVLPIDMVMGDRPQGHGYCEIRVDAFNPFFPQGTVFRGHEFHYTHIVRKAGSIRTVYHVTRGTGSFDRRDGLVYRNVLAGYTHLHAGGARGFAAGLVNAAAAYRSRRPALEIRNQFKNKVQHYFSHAAIPACHN